MTPLAAGVLDAAVQIAMFIFGAATVLAFFRLVRGPSLPDRVVGLDLIGMNATAVMAVYAISTGDPVYLMPAIVVALIIFLGTVAFAYYIEKGGEP